jgi:hypothetical protein
MALASPCVVRIAKPASLSFGEAMSRQRAWLDTNKIQPITFKPDFLDGLIGFEIGFTNEREATLFVSNSVSCSLLQLIGRLA